MSGTDPGADFALVADIAVDAVVPAAQQFRLSGRGSDGQQYRLDIRFELPLDARSRRVVGELLTQSDVGIWRRRGGVRGVRAARGTGSPSG